MDRFRAAERVMDLTIVHADARTMVVNVLAGNAAAQAEIFRPLVERLQAAGADAVAVTSMGGHFCIKELEAISPLPILNAIPMLEADFAQRSLKKIGLLGTRMVMESHVFRGVPSVECVIPQGDDLAAVQDDYLAMASAGRVTEAQRATFFRVGRNLCEKQGAEAVVLAGTDLFLAFQGQDCGFPVIDAAEVHIEAIFRKSIET